MKKFLIHKLPWLYFPARAIYRLTPVYRAKEHRRQRAHAERSARLRERNREIMKTVFADDYRVLGGPFAGMTFVETPSGSTLLPKVVGCYEEPIQDWVDAATEPGRYDKILVVGCAEGYYAVGFAMRLPEATVVAYDIDPVARDLCRRMAEINGVANVDVRERCDWAELAAEIGPRTLIFCDIEGAERALLDPGRVAALAAADLIIESHDSYLPGMTEMLVERFTPTHHITQVTDYPERKNRYALPEGVDAATFAEIIDEHRAPAMKFLYCESLAASAATEPGQAQA